MTTQSGSVWYFLIGAGFIGFWLYMAMFGDAPSGWVLWGLLGLALAAAFYVGRLSNDQVRIGIWIFTGLFLGFLVAAAIMEENAMFVATFVTGVGAGLIAAGLPPYHEPVQPAPQRPITEPQQVNPPSYGAPYQTQTQQPAQGWQPARQQQQQGQDLYGQQYR